MEKVTLSVKEAAEILGIGSSKMYELVRNNQVPNIKLGKRVVLPKAKFLTWVENAAVGGN